MAQEETKIGAPKKGKKFFLLVIGGAVFVLALGAFLIWKFFFNSTGTGQFVSNAKGLKVQPMVTADKTTKVVTAADGGSLDLDNGGGIRSQLILEKDSLPASDSISVAKIDSIGGLKDSWQYVSGVEIGPDGTKLNKNSILKINLPDDITAQKIIGFSFAGDGEDFHFYPIELRGNTAVFQLSSFSGYGILVLKDENSAPPPPSTIERQAQQYIAMITLSGKVKTGGLNEDQLKRIKNILTGWFNASVRPNLKSAQGNDEKLEGAIKEFYNWWKMVQFFGLDDDLNSQIQEGLDSAALGVKNAAEKAGTVCTVKKDPNQASKMIRYFKMTTLLPLEGRSGLSSDKIWELIKKCVNFEVKITSSINHSSQGVLNIVEGSGSGHLTMGDNMKLTGEATFTVSRQQVEGMLPCTVNTPETWPIKFPEVDLATSKEGSKLSLQMDLYSAPDVIWECGASIRQYVDNASVTDPNTAWDFDLIHQDESLGHTETMASYLLKDWQMGGGNGVFAAKNYNRSVPNPYFPGTFIEKTKIELIHAPKS